MITLSVIFLVGVVLGYTVTRHFQESNSLERKMRKKRKRCAHTSFKDETWSYQEKPGSLLLYGYCTNCGAPQLVRLRGMNKGSGEVEEKTNKRIHKRLDAMGWIYDEESKRWLT